MNGLLRAVSFSLFVANSAVAAEYTVARHDEVFGSVEVISARYEDTFVAFPASILGCRARARASSSRRDSSCRVRRIVESS
jgi:hypothetical protein